MKDINEYKREVRRRIVEKKREQKNRRRMILSLSVPMVAVLIVATLGFSGVLGHIVPKKNASNPSNRQNSGTGDHVAQVGTEAAQDRPSPATEPMTSPYVSQAGIGTDPERTAYGTGDVWGGGTVNYQSYYLQADVAFNDGGTLIKKVYFDQGTLDSIGTALYYCTYDLADGATRSPATEDTLPVGGILIVLKDKDGDTTTFEITPERVLVDSKTQLERMLEEEAYQYLLSLTED